MLEEAAFFPFCEGRNRAIVTNYHAEGTFGVCDVDADSVSVEDGN